KTSIARLMNTMLDARELIEAIMLDFGLEPRHDSSKPYLLRDLARFLVDQRNAGRLSLLVTVSYHLDPLKADDTYAYINHRLKHASVGPPLTFSRAVTDIVHQHSRGVARMINVIADAILLYGYGADKHVIDEDLAREVVSELGLGEGHPPSHDDDDDTPVPEPVAISEPPAPQRRVEATPTMAPAPAPRPPAVQARVVMSPPAPAPQLQPMRRAMSPTYRYVLADPPPVHKSAF